MSVKSLKDALIEIDGSSVRIRGSQFYLFKTNVRKETLYLSGHPYLWSGYSDRAFVFSSREQAEELRELFPEDLKESQVGEWKRDE